MTRVAKGLFSRLKRSKLLSLSIKLGLTLAAFWLVLHNIDVEHLTTLVREQDHTKLIAVIILLYIQIALGAIRWRLILYALANTKKHVLSAIEILKLYYISVFFNCCLPGTVGGDVIRVWLAKSDHVPLPLSINSVIIDRLIALLSLSLLVVIMLPFLGAAAGFNAMAVLAAVVVAAVLGIVFLLNIERILDPYKHIRVVHWLLYFTNCLRLLLKNPGASCMAVMYSLISHIVFCFYNYVLARSLGMEITLLEITTFVPLVMLATTLPISIGGWGIREAGTVGMLALIGIPQAQSLLLSIEVGLVTILTSLPAGILWLSYRKQNQEESISNPSMTLGPGRTK